MRKKYRVNRDAFTRDSRYKCNKCNNLHEHLYPLTAVPVNEPFYPFIVYGNTRAARDDG